MNRLFLRTIALILTFCLAQEPCLALITGSVGAHCCTPFESSGISFDSRDIANQGLFSEQAFAQRLADFPRRLRDSLNTKPTARLFGWAWDEWLAWATGYGGGNGRDEHVPMHEVQWNSAALEEDANFTSTESAQRTGSAKRYAAKLSAFQETLLSPHDRMKQLAKELQRSYARSPDEAAAIIRQIIDEGHRRGIRVLMEMIKSSEEDGVIDADQHDLRHMVWKCATAASFGGEENMRTYMHRKRQSHGNLSDEEAALPLLPWDSKAMTRMRHFLVKGWLPEEARLWVGRYLGQLPLFAKTKYTLEMRGAWPSYCWSEDLFFADEFLTIKKIHFAERKYSIIGVHTGTILQKTFSNLDNVIVTAIVNPSGFIKLAGGRPSLTGYVQKGNPLPWASLDPKHYAYARVELFIKDGLICFCRVVDTGEILYFTRVWHRPTKRYVTSFYGKLSEKEWRVKQARLKDFEMHPYTTEMFEAEQRLAATVEQEPKRRSNPPSATVARRTAPAITPHPMSEPAPAWAQGWHVRLTNETAPINPLGSDISNANSLITPDGKEFAVGGIAYDGKIGIRISAISWQHGFIPKIAGETVQADDEPAGHAMIVSGFGVSLLGLTPFDKPNPDVRKKRRSPKSEDPFWSDVELSLSSDPSYRRNWVGVESVLLLGIFVGVPIMYFLPHLGLFGGHWNVSMAFRWGGLAMITATLYRWGFSLAHGFRWKDGWQNFFRSGQFAKTRGAVLQLEKVFYETLITGVILSSWIRWSPWIPLVIAALLVMVAHYINDWSYQGMHPDKSPLKPPLSLECLDWLYRKFYRFFAARLGLVELSLRPPLPKYHGRAWEERVRLAVKQLRNLVWFESAGPLANRLIEAIRKVQTQLGLRSLTTDAEEVWLDRRRTLVAMTDFLEALADPVSLQPLVTKLEPGKEDLDPKKSDREKFEVTFPSALGTVTATLEFRMSPFAPLLAIHLKWKMQFLDASWRLLNVTRLGADAAASVRHHLGALLHIDIGQESETYLQPWFHNQPLTNGFSISRSRRQVRADFLNFLRACKAYLEGLSVNARPLSTREAA